MCIKAPVTLIWLILFFCVFFSADVQVKLVDLVFHNEQHFSHFPSSLTIDIRTNSSHFTIPASINREIDHSKIPLHLNDGQRLQETDDVSLDLDIIFCFYS